MRHHPIAWPRSQPSLWATPPPPPPPCLSPLPWAATPPRAVCPSIPHGEPHGGRKCSWLEETRRRRREAPGGRREARDGSPPTASGHWRRKTRHVDSRGEAWRRGKGRGNLQKFRQCNKVQGMNRVSGRAGDDKKRSWLLPRQSSIVVGGFARGVDSKVWWWLVVPLRMAARRCRRGGGWHEIGLALHWHWSLPCPASQRQCQHPPRARCPLLLVIQLRAPVCRPA